MSWETNPKEINKLMKEKMNDEQALKANIFRLKMRLPVKSGLLFETASFHPLTTQILEAMAKSRRMLEAEVGEPSYVYWLFSDDLQIESLVQSHEKGVRE